MGRPNSSTSRPWSSSRSGASMCAFGFAPGSPRRRDGPGRRSGALLLCLGSGFGRSRRQGKLLAQVPGSAAGQR